MAGPLSAADTAPELSAAERLERDRQARRSGRSFRPVGGRSLRELFPSLGGGVTRVELALFSRQLATFIAAGVPVTQAIAVIGRESSSPTLRGVLESVQQEISRGSSVSDALAQHPRVFDPLYLSLVRAAELSGTLDGVLKGLDVHLTRADRAAKEIRSAMTYPAMVGLLALVAVVILVGFVLPQFATLFAEFGTELPAPTRLLLAIAGFTTAYRIHLVVGAAIVAAAAAGSQRTERGRDARDALLLRLPVIGELIRFGTVSRFCRTLGTLLSAGVPIARSFDVVANAVTNRVLHARLLPVKAQLLAGEGFAKPLAATGIFPGTVIQMVGVGEETGALERFLADMADFYENELEFKLHGAIQLIEPMLLLSVGGVVGFIAVALISAIYSLTSAVR